MTFSARKKLCNARILEFCNRDTKAIILNKQGKKTITIITLNKTVVIPDVVVLKRRILSL